MERTLTACEICEIGRPIENMIRYTNGTIVCKECSELQVDIRGEATREDKTKILKFIKEIKENDKRRKEKKSE